MMVTSKQFSGLVIASTASSKRAFLSVILLVGKIWLDGANAEVLVWSNDVIVKNARLRKTQLCHCVIRSSGKASTKDGKTWTKIQEKIRSGRMIQIGVGK